MVRDYALSEALLKAGRDAGRLSELGGVSWLCETVSSLMHNNWFCLLMMGHELADASAEVSTRHWGLHVAQKLSLISHSLLKGSWE